MIDEGWINAGDVVIDPFGGVGLGGLDAMRYGCTWVGVELEARFVALGNQNINLWNNRYAPHFPGWGTARLIQGDSRKLLEVIGEAGAVVSSPPYADGCAHKGGDDPKPEYIEGGEIHLPGIHGMVSSPPYAETDLGGDGGILTRDDKMRKSHGMLVEDINYGTTPGQLGGADDFWLAARQIVDQVYAALAPGGHAVWVVKHFVKYKQRVDFPGQWRQLCEAAGFVTVHEHRAWLVEDKGTQFTLDGNRHSRKIERKSFFRRLAENKGSPRIDWETVYCMRKTPR